MFFLWCGATQTRLKNYKWPHQQQLPLDYLIITNYPLQEKHTDRHSSDQTATHTKADRAFTDNRMSWQMVSVQSGSGCTHIKLTSLSLTPHPLLLQTLVHLKGSGVKSYQILPLPFSLHSPSFLTLSLSPPSLTTLPHHPPSPHSLTTLSLSPPSLTPLPHHPLSSHLYGCRIMKVECHLVKDFR